MAQTYSDKPTLEAWNALAEAVGSAPKIAFGTYRGSGEFGSGHKNTLTFDFEPKFIFVHSSQGLEVTADANSAHMYAFMLMRPATHFTMAHNVNSVIVSWGDRSVSWYSSTSVGGQLNYATWDYYYIALG